MPKSHYVANRNGRCGVMDVLEKFGPSARQIGQWVVVYATRRHGNRGVPVLVPDMRRRWSADLAFAHPRCWCSPRPLADHKFGAGYVPNTFKGCGPGGTGDCQ